jgi:hypothetical protein
MYPNGGLSLDLGKSCRANQPFCVKGEIRRHETPKEKTTLEIFELVSESEAGIDRLN